MSTGRVRALVIDKEAAMRRYLRLSLVEQGYTVFEANSGQEALSTITARRPDVVILDLELPDLDGIEMTRLLRQWTRAPILIVSAQDSEAAKIAALDAGADDYVTIPFGIGEMLARVRVALRRTGQAEVEPVLTLGQLVVDPGRRLVTVEGHEVQLTPTEYELLRTLIVHRGKVLTHGQLLDAVWGPAHEQKTHMLRVNISNLRRKLESDPAHPCYVLTVPGVGYRFRPQ